MADVLIVDDDADIRTAMRAVLEEVGGHAVTEVTNGLEALEVLRRADRPLVVLLDLLMPGLDGIGVLEAVAADEELATRHAFVLVTVSRRALDRDFPATLALAVPVIPKPFDMDVLLHMVDDAIARTQSAPAIPYHAPAPEVAPPDAPTE